MQPDLPWNVAGIPPEAREAARAAARREGLSVGEWMTRRILRSMTEGTPISDPAPAWHGAEFATPKPHAEPPSPSVARDTEDMLARVSRSESESQNATKRIEDQLRSVARRLDQSERSHAENNRAMSKAAAEINIAAREQAQAFDQLGAHVMGLNDRLSRIERESAADGLKDAVKALHQGLSRLADQMSQTANQSASQIAALAGNVEQVAGKLMEARGEVDHVSLSFKDRIASVESRLANAERETQSNARAADKVMGSIQAAHDLRSGLEAELQRQASGLAQLNQTLDQLSSRFTAGDAQQSGAMARLEEQVARLEVRGTDPGSERRLQGIEHALTDLVTRLEKTESSNLGAAGTVEEGLRNLAMRVDAADRRHREAVAELRAAVKEASGRLEAVDPTPPAPPPPPPAPPPAAQQAAVPNFELPPFPEHGGPFQPPPPFADAPPMPDAPPAFGPDAAFGGPAFGADTFASTAAHQAGAAGAESFLAAARRSARAAAAGEIDQGAGPFGFTWGAAREAEPEKKSGVARYALMATLGFLIIAAVAAGVVLNRNVMAPSAAQLSVKPASPSASAANVPQPAPLAAQPSAATHVVSNETGVPGSPVIAHRLKPPASRTHTAIESTQAPLINVAAPKATPPQQTAAVASLDRLSSLANSGNAKAELLLGLKLLDGEGVNVNEAEAAKWLERAARQSEPVAAYRLGTLYERGHGVPADPAKAAQWYEVAAKGGNRKAMHNLAVAYADGNGVQKDLVVAAQWFTRAANLGLADSQFNLAVLYERGMGVQQSLIDAYKWYAVAAQQGDAESKARIDAISTQLSPEDKTAAQKAAESFRAESPEHAANIPPDPSMVLGG
ncbi:MAG: hypothetical protein ABSD74_15010 [Rhizomicrobium sp.]|jgi:localization factor PodJL